MSTVSLGQSRMGWPHSLGEASFSEGMLPSGKDSGRDWRKSLVSDLDLKPGCHLTVCLPTSAARLLVDLRSPGDVTEGGAGKRGRRPV